MSVHRPPIVSPELHDRLFNDDLPMEFSECSVEQLDAWVESNVLHATTSCALVMMHWRRDKATDVVRVLAALAQPHWERRLCRYIAAALEEGSARRKFSVLEGQFTDKGPTTLYNYLWEVSDKQEVWSVLSPSWSGVQGSELRDAAIKLGWTPYSLMAQSYAGLAQPLAHRKEPPSWAALVRYPHSLMVLHWHLAAHVQDKPVRISAPWADPVDAALARHLAQHLFAPNDFSFVRHPDVPWLDLVQDGLIEGWVQCHAGLGILQSELLPYLVANELPISLGRVETSIDLPNMDREL